MGYIVLSIQNIAKVGGFFLIYTALAFYMGWNGWVWLETSFGASHIYVYGVIVAVFAYSYLISQPFSSASPVRVIGSYWLGIFQYALLIFPLADLVAWILQTTVIDREDAIVWTGIAVVALFIWIFVSGTFNAYSPVVRPYEVTVAKNAGSRKQLRIAMASDMHFGTLSGRAHARRLVAKINELKPDLILLPGDIIDDDPKAFMKKGIGDILKELHAPLGVYGVLGNHEYYGKQIPVFLEEMKRINIEMLLDETVMIDDSFYLVGRRDKTDRQRESFQQLTSSLRHEIPIIAMDHQPSDLQNAEESRVDLLLSGHTHRGQMAPNHLFTKKLFEVDWGYLRKNQMHVIVSSGFGFWGPPLRLGSRSEIIEIDVTFNA